MTEQKPPESQTARTETAPTANPGAGQGEPSGMQSLHDAAFTEEERFGGDNLDLLIAMGLGLMVTAFFYEVFPIPFMDQKKFNAPRWEPT